MAAAEESIPPLCEPGWIVRERLLGRFEDEWTAGQRPRIEDWLAGDLDPADRAALLVELVHTELELRLRAGAPVQVVEYLQRFPALASDDTNVRGLFDAADRHLRGVPDPEEATPSRGGDPPPRRLGKYELFEVVGEGSFGVVYRAHDTQLDRIVAIKLPRSGYLSDGDAEARFRREARSLARLCHPGIVALHDATPIDGTFALISEFVAGTTLAQRLAQGGFQPRQAAELVGHVADAVAAAHRQGVIHRDLKPANIMIDDQGRPRVMDFGLARLDAGADATLTADGEMLGTPAYMSPEQARGDSHRVDALSDVYSLGTILYQLLTGTLPFRGQGHSLLGQIIAEEPRSPRRLDDRIPRDLETICLKCLEKEPDRRYDDAAALASDLGAFLAGEPIRARPVPRWEQALKRVRRRPLMSALVASTVVAVLGLLASWLYQTDRERQHALADARSQRAHQVALHREAEALRRNLYDLEVGQAYEAWERGQGELTRSLLEKQRPRPGADDEDLRGFEWYYLWRLCDQDLVLRGHAGAVRRVAFAPDGGTLATASTDHTVKLWDTTHWSPRCTLSGHARAVTGLAYAPDGKVVYTCSLDGSMKRWDARTGDLLGSFEGDVGAILCLALSADGRALALGGAGPRSPAVLLIDTSTGQERGRLVANAKAVSGLAFAPDGSTLAALAADRTLRLWDVAAGKVRLALGKELEDITSVAFSPDGKRVATSGQYHAVTLWDATTGAELARFPKPELPSAVSSLAFAPEEGTLAIGYQDRVMLWDLRADRARARLGVHTGKVTGLVFSPDGALLATGGDDGLVRLWEATAARPRPRPGAASDAGVPTQDIDVGDRPGVPPTCLAFAPDGRTIAVGNGQGSTAVCDLGSGQVRHRLRHGTERVRGLAFAADSRTLAVACDHTRIQLWDVFTGRPRYPLTSEGYEHTRWWSLAATPDGKTVVAGQGDPGKPGAVVIWDPGSGKNVDALLGHSDYVRAVALAPDGRTLASGSGDETVKLWDLTTRRELATLRGHRGLVFCLAFAPDGSYLASGSDDHTVRLWPRDAARGREPVTLRGPRTPILSLAFSPDGRRLATASQDGSILLWDMTTHRSLARLDTLKGSIPQVAFSPDGTILASPTFDGRIKLRSAGPGPAPGEALNISPQEGLGPHHLARPFSSRLRPRPGSPASRFRRSWPGSRPPA